MGAEAYGTDLATFGPLAAVASAEGGALGPAGNGASMWMLHPNEMVLPAPLSQGFQNILNGGNTSRTSTLNANVHTTFNGITDANFKQMLTKHSSYVARTVMSAVRRTNQV